MARGGGGFPFRLYRAAAEGNFTGVGNGDGYRFEAVTPQRGADLAAFSRDYGTFGYCSCQRWRLPSGRYRDLGRDGRAAALGDLVRAGQPVGVLAYQGERAVGWCSIAPRESYRAILASRVIPQLPGDGVWSVACFFLAPSARRQGLTALLLDAACAYAAQSGALIAEAYPWPGGASYRYMGTRELYLAAGFHDLPVPPGYRPVMRRLLPGAPEAAATTTRKPPAPAGS
jgi:GNAT superfamily N-acetyltransferase